MIEVSENAKKALAGTVEGMLIIQDREGDIYEQFAPFLMKKLIY